MVTHSRLLQSTILGNFIMPSFPTCGLWWGQALFLPSPCTASFFLMPYFKTLQIIIHPLSPNFLSVSNYDVNVWTDPPSLKYVSQHVAFIMHVYIQHSLIPRPSMRSYLRSGNETTQLTKSSNISHSHSPFTSPSPSPSPPPLHTQLPVRTCMYSIPYFGII